MRSFGAVLPIDDVAVLVSGVNGQLDGSDLPDGIGLDDIRPDHLAELQTVSGNRGNTVWAAAPTRTSNGRLVVVVLTREANAGLGASVGYFLVAAAATLVLGALVADLARAATHPPAARRVGGDAAHRRRPAGDARRGARPPTTTTSWPSCCAASTRWPRGWSGRRCLEQQFLLSVSHDLRTPLTSIRGYAEAISDGAAEPAAAASVIQSESRRLERLVADLLDLAKLQSRSFSLHPTRLDLARRESPRPCPASSPMRPSAT